MGATPLPKHLEPLEGRPGRYIIHLEHPIYVSWLDYPNEMSIGDLLDGPSIYQVHPGGPKKPPEQPFQVHPA